MEIKAEDTEEIDKEAIMRSVRLEIIRLRLEELKDIGDKNKNTMKPQEKK